MPQVRYTPKKGGQFFAPTLAPGEVIDVSREEAEHLLATGVFEKVTSTKAAPAVEEPPAAAGKRS